MQVISFYLVLYCRSAVLNMFAIHSKDRIETILCLSFLVYKPSMNIPYGAQPKNLLSSFGSGNSSERPTIDQGKQTGSEKSRQHNLGWLCSDLCDFPLSHREREGSNMQVNACPLLSSGKPCYRPPSCAYCSSTQTNMKFHSSIILVCVHQTNVLMLIQ